MQRGNKFSKGCEQKKNAEAKEVQFLCETQERAIFQMPKGIC